VSSKNINKKFESNNDKAEQQALKEVETIAELAPNEKTRKEAERLMEIVEDGPATTVQEQEQEAIGTVLDKTKRTIKKTVSEAKREIPRYTKAFGQLQELSKQLKKLGMIV
jgi:paraquat-inducible protein B